MAKTEHELSLQRVYQDYLRTMYVMFKTAFVFDTNNQALVQAADRVAAAANTIRADVADVASLELLADGMYVNRTLLKLDARTYEQADYLYTVMSTLGVAAVAATDDTSSEDWLQLITAFKTCVGPGGNLTDFAKSSHKRIKLTAASGKAATNNLLAASNRFRALRAYATAVIAIGDIIDSARENRVLRPLRVKRPVQEMVSLSEEASSLLLALAHLKRHKLTPAHHLINCAVYVMCAMRPLELRRADTCALALSAALHDLGRALEPASDGLPGPAAERRYALDSVRKLVGTPLASAQMSGRAIIANEVRRWVDRQSEPKGDAEYPFVLGVASRLVAVAHAYSLLTTPLADRPCLLPDEALRVIMRDAGRRYDAAAVKLFVNALGIYPVGSTVALSDGRLAIVVEAPYDAGPDKPKVKVVRDRSGATVDGELVDLAASGALTILRCIDAEDQDINAPAFLLS